MVILVTFRLSDDVRSEDVDGTTVLLREDGAAAVLNRQASVLLSLLIEHLSIRKALDAVCARYDASEERVREDMKALVAELEGCGMVHADVQ